MTRYQLRAVVRGKDKTLCEAGTREAVERVQPAFEAAMRRPVLVVPVERSLPDDEASWRAEAA